ncbi:unnamed protein product [Haemonchus placei]|uniref:RNAse_A_bac domain-containing protein n=1 Tax=Haemonchus placei TaxID=6290 RepID=A0A0N4X7E1_HAEPC|nr:unnamed protein product [Haemonchus placei]
MKRSAGRTDCALRTAEAAVGPRQVLEKRYGGRARANRAAIIIQRAYRDYRMNRRWREMTSPTQRYPLSAALDEQLLLQSRAAQTKLAKDRISNRYLPFTSLSAQLRADRAQLAGSSELLSRNKRNPPSPSPSPNPNRSMIDQLWRLSYYNKPVVCGEIILSAKCMDGSAWQLFSITIPVN